MVRRARELLEAQGVRIVLPERGAVATGDVLVEPSGEELRALGARIEARFRVKEEDPWRALFAALFVPRGASYIRAGIDPGLSCALAAFGDNLLIWAESLACDEVVDRLLWLRGVVRAPVLRVSLGAGEGYEVVAERLIEEGVPFTLVPENGTSRRDGSPYRLRDRDIMAAVRLALGAGGGI